MTLRFFKCLLIGVMAALPLGCEPRPMVVNPDDDDAAVIEDDADVDIDTDGTTIAPPADRDTNVDIGTGGTGVDIGVDSDAANQQPNAGTNQPNTNQ